MSPDDWRLTEALKMLRQIVTCPLCGALVSQSDGLTIHTNWHNGMNNMVNQIGQNFDLIFEYVTNPDTGLEKRLSDLINDAGTAINTLRTDATTAIDTTNDSVNTLRTDATTAIGEDRTRLGNIETEITRTPGGIWNRLEVLEAAEAITTNMGESPIQTEEN